MNTIDQSLAGECMTEEEREAIEYGANALGVAAERMPSEFERLKALEAEAVIRAFLERTQ